MSGNRLACVCVVGANDALQAMLRGIMGEGWGEMMQSRLLGLHHSLLMVRGWGE